MKKTVLIFAALLMSMGFSFANVDLTNPDLMSQGPLTQFWNNATYDAATQTITFPGAWAGAGWDFWTTSAIPWTTLTVEFTPVDYDVLLTIQFNDGDNSVTPVIPNSPQVQSKVAGGQGIGTISIDIPAIAIGQIVLQNSAAGDLTIISATLSNGAATPTGPVLKELPVPGDLNADPAASDYDAKHPGWSVNTFMDTVAIAKYLVLETNGVGDNATGFGGIQMAYQGGNTPSLGWTQADLLSGGWVNFTRGNGIVSIAINLQNVMGANWATFIQFPDWAQILIGYYPTTGSAIDGLALTNAYLTSDFAEPSDAVDLTGGTDFGFIFNGSVKDQVATAIPVVTVPASQPAYGVINGIVVNAANENVSIYGIDGRLVKQVVANNQTIDMPKGLYIVKVGAQKAVKVVVE
jgi:hypothetical protein